MNFMDVSEEKDMRMRIVVIGAYGHIGSYLVPKLVRSGNDVIAVSRGQHKPYVKGTEWEHISRLSLDRVKDHEFNRKIAELGADVVVDLISFSLDDTKGIVGALEGTELSHYLFCSSIWAHGRAETLPVDPNAMKAPLDDYGINKYNSELFLKEEFRKKGFPSTVIMPGQISGPGWTIINPQGNTDIGVFQDIADGRAIALPNFGMETLHHVHADDVAQMFFKAIEHRNQALGESFHAVAAESMTLYGYAKAMYRFFDQEPDIEFMPWPQWVEHINNESLSEHTFYHIARSGQYSIENARTLIGYVPKFGTLETVEQAVRSYIDRGLVSAANGV
ncbi:MAG: NAD-dependent epimerase/dehydratase family protein [Bifidobacterium crudilactis]|uniref:NAD-dependent epimerase/dehydratase family protein n=1 Tax=Bifidobacterium crudilactis TaxID=327277 RepID=UPI003A5BB726